MLDSLPPEIIEQILGHLSTAASIANVARTNRKLHATVSADNYGIFRVFVQNCFPSVSTPPLWVDMARALTSRSRAWQRRAFIARECHPPEDDSIQLARGSHQRFGYMPVIDSYDHWDNGNFTDKKQVLAFGAGGRLRLRIVERNQTRWMTFSLPDDHLARNDILDVRLLRPHQHGNKHGETIIIRKANREIIKLESGVGKDNFTQVSRFPVDGTHVDCLDINTNPNALLAICTTQSLQLFPTYGTADDIRPTSVFPFPQRFDVKHRKRCVKFLDDHTIAVGVQLLEGRERAPISVYDISAAGITLLPLEPLAAGNLDPSPKGRHCANVITSLDNNTSAASRSGKVFLSGWSDGITRLYDLRTPLGAVAEYTDFVDDGQILSLAAVGHERFFAGSHQNACLKCFDLRMSGATVYSYTEALPRSRSRSGNVTTAQASGEAASRRDINIFLALAVQRNHLWARLPRQQNSTNLSRYRGSVYSLSIPSPSSPTMFVGIENHVVRFDFVSSDDVLRKHSWPCDPAAGLSTLTRKPDVDNVLSLGCYERPRDDHVATDLVLLRKQVEWNETVQGISDTEQGPPEDGWDHRWRLSRGMRTGGGGNYSRRWRSGQPGPA